MAMIKIIKSKLSPYIQETAIASKNTATRIEYPAA